MKQIFMIDSEKGLTAEEIHGCIEDMTISEENEIVQVREIHNEMREGISKEMEDELYSFIVDSNFEWALINQLNNPERKEAFVKWLQLGEDKDD